MSKLSMVRRGRYRLLIMELLWSWTHEETGLKLNFLPVESTE